MTDDKPEKCYMCGHVHKMMMTPGILNHVHCPYDQEGKARMSGMENAVPHMIPNQYGVWEYSGYPLQPGDQRSSGNEIEENNKKK